MLLFCLVGERTVQTMTCKECVNFEQCPYRNNYPFPFDIKQFCKSFKERGEADGNNKNIHQYQVRT